ncbi:arylesterase [Crenobacter cavernae]|uniref:arylesterase n=1 Tax=Crenobacter cavernae TaxID=2290923 RepID=UPI0015F1A7D3|nr:arylesterase [Crenobacter cavernae]
MRFLYRWLNLVVLALTALPAAAATVMVFGDSLSAGYGLSPGQGWVALMQTELGTKHRIVNASLSGETTAGGLTRLPDALKKHKPDVVVIELGANDGLRGLPIDAMQDNLAKMVGLARHAGAKPVLVGMALPPNYGPQYTAKFRGSYAALARREKLPFVPLLFAGFATDRARFQGDGIHPNAGAQPVMRDTVLKTLRPLLR